MVSPSYPFSLRAQTAERLSESDPLVSTLKQAYDARRRSDSQLQKAMYPDAPPVPK